MKKHISIFILFIAFLPLSIYADPVCDAAAGPWSGTLDEYWQTGAVCHFPVQVQASVNGTVIILDGQISNGWSPNPGVNCLGNSLTLMGTCNNGALSLMESGYPLTGAVISNVMAFSGVLGSAPQTSPVTYTFKR